MKHHPTSEEIYEAQKKNAAVQKEIDELITEITPDKKKNELDSVLSALMAKLREHEKIWDEIFPLEEE